MNSVKVTELIEEIKAGIKQKSASAKDEERVMRAMLNDKEYVVGVYAKEGKVGEFTPAKTAREMVASVIQSAVGVSKEEAANLAEDHTFKKSESQAFVDISKEFVNTYVQTERKLPLGKREFSDVSLSLKHVPETMRPYPKRVGINPDGTIKRETGRAKVKPHDTLKVHSSVPEYL